MSDVQSCANIQDIADKIEWIALRVIAIKVLIIHAGTCWYPVWGAEVVFIHVTLDRFLKLCLISCVWSQSKFILQLWEASGIKKRERERELWTAVIPQLTLQTTQNRYILPGAPESSDTNAPYNCKLHSPSSFIVIWLHKTFHVRAIQHTKR